jgi:hypothetical protein
MACPAIRQQQIAAESPSVSRRTSAFVKKTAIFILLSGKMSPNVSAVYDVLPAAIEQCVALRGWQNVAE